MAHTDGKFVAASGDDELEFAADSPKGVVKRKPQSGDIRATEAPEDEIEEHRDIAYTDPHVHEGFQTLLDWIVGDGYNLSPRNIPGSSDSQGQDDSEVVRVRELMQNSNFWRVFNDWVYFAMVDGHAFMELVVEDEQFDPRLLPTERMSIQTDEFGRVTEYILSPPGGGGGDDDITYEPHEVAELYFRKEPTQDFGRSFVEPISEQADMLRDMEIDYARFIATKAYPPVLWKLGSEEEKWTESQIENWLDTVEAIEPDSMLAAGHDVESEVVGVTSTSSTAGAMRLEGTFEHLENRVITGLGLPAILMNEEGGGQGDAVANMPAYKRRIRRLQNIVKSAVEQQILKSLMVESGSFEDFDSILPEFEFGEYSSAEKRLEVDKLLKLFNHLALTPEAFAERVGIDPETELPDIWQNVNGEEQLEILLQLGGNGDNIANPQGGSPTDTGGGAESAGGEVTSRQDPGADSSNGRNKKSPTEEED